ncbi:K02A2.6-like [Cordylochernes scorpioides]|uniref:RNA-directed DNA polymerase n=1 Tax=Cordylochernes scorpioides TaxID=51811 RepID=A0ABY6KCE1_9ARAC|nr:K02A2.6-like [Cordylochernes scorpioides]
MRQDTDNRNVDALDKKGGRNGTSSQKTKLKGTKRYNSNFTKNHQGWSSNEKRKCFRCGYYQGHSKEQCPAKDVICNKCRKKGHFAKVCHTKTIQEVSSSQDNQFNGIVGKQENTEDKWCEVIKVNDQPIKFKIDTGAEVSVMPEEIYLQYFGYLKMEKADKNIFSVSKNMEVNEMFQAFLESKRQKYKENIYIGKRVARPLLSCRASEILGLVRKINIIENHAPTKLDPMLKFPKFYWTGKNRYLVRNKVERRDKTLFDIYTKKKVTFRYPFRSGKFSKRMSEILEGLEGTLCHMGDILVYGSCQEEYDKRLEAVLTKLSKSGLTLNKDKGKFAVTTIKFLGQKIDPNGIQVDSKRKRAILEFPKPRSVKELKQALAITWACEKFKQYIQGLVINLETDHKPLVPIFTSKNIDDLTPRIQRLRLRMMRYSYKILHEPEKNLIVADALPKSPWIKVGTQELEEELCAYVQQVISFMPISDVRLKEIKERQNKDQEGWPERTNVSMSESQYWPVKDYFSVENDTLSRRISGKGCTKESMGHLGIVKCRERAKGSVWWTQITSEIEEMVRTCPMCIEERTNRHQPLLPSEFPSCPWEKVEVDLFTIKDQNYLLITDYYSKYPEIARLKDMTSASVIVHCMSIFARHGIPLEVRNYGFTHVTSSPRYPQSNGFIESFARIVKERIAKSKDPYLALLAYRATPLANGFSPAELSMRRRI